MEADDWHKSVTFITDDIEEEGDSLMSKVERWTFDAPSGVIKNEALQRELYEIARRPSAFAHLFPDVPRPTRWQRLKWWLADHRPTLHFGPCDHSECDRC